MEILDRFAQLDYQPQPVGLHHVVLHVDEIGQADSLDQFHHQELLIARRAAVLQGMHDMRVEQLEATSPSVGFTRSAEAGLVAERLVHVEDFKRDDAADALVDGPPDLRHAAVARAGRSDRTAARCRYRLARIVVGGKTTGETSMSAHIAQ